MLAPIYNSTFKSSYLLIVLLTMITALNATINTLKQSLRLGLRALEIYLRLECGD